MDLSAWPSHLLQVPLYMTALAIYEKTLGPEHPEVAKDLVNLGNAFCDQDQHSEAVPLYLRALAIDQAALGDEHPEVAMDLSNLGIVYRVQGRPDEATALFQRAHAIMLAALGPDDPKTHTVARNLASTLQPQLDASQPAAEHTREARAPPPHRPTAATPSAHPIATPSPHHRHTIQGGRTSHPSRRIAPQRAPPQDARPHAHSIPVQPSPRGKPLRPQRASRRPACYSRSPSSMLPSYHPIQARVEKDADSSLLPAQRTLRGAHAPPRAPGSEPPPVAPPTMPLNLKPRRAAADAADAPSAGGCATPRSTYSKASHEAQAAAADSRGVGGSGHSLLHNYVQQNT